MSEIFTGHCPYCGIKLEYDKDDKTIFCPACDSSVSVSQLGGKSSSTGIANEGVSPLAALMGFDNPESGVVFLENFFDTYDWSEYQETEELELKEISEVIRNNKIKNGAEGQSWYLDFKGLAVPVSKKFEGLANKASEIGEKYDPEDSASLYEAFDVYRKVNNMLLEKKDAIVKYLETAVSYAERFNLAKDKLAEIKAELERVKKQLSSVVEVKEINEVPAFVNAKEVINRRKCEELAKRNIDAKSVYASAVEQYNSTNPNKSDALAKFESIRGYADSVEYIKKINKYFNFNSEMFYFFGKYYIFKEEAFSLAALDVAALGKKKKKTAEEQPSEEEQQESALSLYEVVNGVPAEKPAVKGIEEMLTCYNNKLYYFKRNQGVFSYDLYSGAETQLDKGKDDHYCKRGGRFECAIVRSDTAIVIKKKLQAVIKKGCFGRVKKKSEDEQMLNNFCLLLVDMKTNSARVVTEELVDVVDHYGDKVFYTHATQETKKQSFLAGCTGKKEEIAPVTSLMVCDLETGENKQVLSEACEIHNVSGNTVIYSLWKPNQYNRDLHVYDLKTGEDALIEDNIYNYFGVINNQLYYTIGNASYCPLMRNNFKGDDRKEIMQNVENIIGNRAGWLYVKKGVGRNSILVKVNPDNVDTRIIVCTQFKKIVEFTASHIHYLDTSDSLRVVRTDGKENREIAKNIKWTIVGEKCLYYVRTERVEARENAMSLYKMDKDGHNVRKLVFNLNDAIDYDEKSLYYKKEEDVRFEVIKPTAKKEKKGKKETPVYETYHVKRFFKFDKATEKSEVVLTLGLPSGKEAVKRGCFGKTVDEDIVYNEAPVVREYKPKGLMAVGAMEKEQTQEAVEQANTNIDKIAEKLPDGCASIFKKIKGAFKGGR